MSFRFLVQLTFLVMCLLSSHAANAQDVDNGAFSNGNAGAPPNQDSENVPGLAMQPPTYGGTGCPQGTVSAALTPDQKELSLLFDSYIVKAGGQTNQPNATANCQVKLNFTVPPGYQAQIVKIDYRGFESVPAGAGARISTTFGYEEWNGHALPMRKCARWTNFTGPSQQNFQLSSIIQGQPFSPCGQSFTLTAESMVQVATNQNREETLMSVDSLDAVALPMKLSLRWQRCQPQQGPGGPWPGGFRPPGPGGVPGQGPGQGCGPRGCFTPPPRQWPQQPPPAQWRPPGPGRQPGPGGPPGPGCGVRPCR